MKVLNFLLLEKGHNDLSQVPVKNYSYSDQCLDLLVSLLDLPLKCDRVGVLLSAGLEQSLERFLTNEQFIILLLERDLSLTRFLQLASNLVTMSYCLLEGCNIKDLALDPIIKVIEWVFESLSLKILLLLQSPTISLRALYRSL